MTLDDALDHALVRALHGGPAALPECPRRLAGYLETIEHLLTEKARENAPTWDEACVAASEVETLLALERAVAERVIGLRGDTIGTVIGKLMVWRALRPAGADDTAMLSLRDRLVLSLEADLIRLARAERA
jgi:hypothetical protein